MLFSQITSVENKYKGRASALTEKAKLTNVILRSPRLYQTTIQTTHQLTKREIPPREPTVEELRRDMYDFWRATVEPYAKGKGKSHHQEMSLYTGDDSDGSVDSQKKWSNKKKSRRNNPQEARRCYGCGKKGHIKRDCKQKKSFKSGDKDCSHCHKKGHSESSCWKKHPNLAPDWVKRKSNREIAGIALDEEIAFMSTNAPIPVETINESKSTTRHESSSAEDSDDESEDDMPPLVPRNMEDSDDEDSDEEVEEAGPFPAFAKTYRTKVGQDLKAEQERWIMKKLRKEGFTLRMFYNVFPVREKYAY